MNKRQIGYMRDLIDVLRAADEEYKKDPSRHFDMGAFVPNAANLGVKIDEEIEAGLLPEDFCRSPGCALGHYIARYPRRNGFKDIRDIKELVPEFWGFGGAFNHAKDHFGLSHFEAELLFDAEGCGGAQTAGDAADYIERFLEDRLSKGDDK